MGINQGFLKCISGLSFFLRNKTKQNKLIGGSPLLIKDVQAPPWGFKLSSSWRLACGFMGHLSRLHTLRSSLAELTVYPPSSISHHHAFDHDFSLP